MQLPSIIYGARHKLPAICTQPACAQIAGWSDKPVHDTATPCPEGAAFRTIQRAKAQESADDTLSTADYIDGRHSERADMDNHKTQKPMLPLVELGLLLSSCTGSRHHSAQQRSRHICKSLWKAEHGPGGFWTKAIYRQ